MRGAATDAPAKPWSKAMALIVSAAQTGARRGDWATLRKSLSVDRRDECEYVLNFLERRTRPSGHAREIEGDATGAT